MNDQGAGRLDPPRALLDRKVKLACSQLWKLYGSGADHFIAAEGGRADEARLAELQLIGAVRDVNLAVHEGEIFIVMGLSGSGKSTLVRCLSRLIEPSYGRVMLDGRDLLKASAAELIDIRRHNANFCTEHFLPFAVSFGPRASRILAVGLGASAPPFAD